VNVLQFHYLEATRYWQMQYMGISQVRKLPFCVSGGFITTTKMIEAKEARERISTS